MSSTELDRILTDAQRFLQQEKLLFGNTLYPEPRTRAAEPAPTAVTGPEPMAPKKKPTSAPAVAAAPTTSAAEKWQKDATLDALNRHICECTKCRLGATRTKFVFGVGNPNADVMVIGEAPGADEDKQGEPFVGRAGQLLNKILEAINFKREEVYIANILKCRPPENRRPHPDEVEQCEPYLWKQIELIRPKFILALGLTAAQTLLKTTESLTQLRASVHDYHGVPLYVTYHPAALLRNPEWKRPTWEDVQKLRKAYDESKK